MMSKQDRGEIATIEDVVPEGVEAGPEVVADHAAKNTGEDLEVEVRAGDVEVAAETDIGGEARTTDDIAVRGRHLRSRNRSRSRSRRRRSRSSSRDRRKNRSLASSSKSSSRSRSSSRDRKFGREDIKEDIMGTKDLSSHIPSAEALAKIESDGFAPEAFVSCKSSKRENGDLGHSSEMSHEGAIFGTSGSQISKNSTNAKSNDVHLPSSGKAGGIMASLLHEREQVKNDRWIKKLQAMRQKRLLNS